MNSPEAKAEIDRAIELKKRTTEWSGAFEAYAYDVDDLSEELNEKVDYIFTDPPYGGHISYLDLSTLWNAWLGSNPSLEIRKKELIVGGELKLTEADYTARLGKSIKLKRNAHFDVSEMLHKILSRASSGRLYGEYLFNKLVIEAWSNASINSLNISRTDFIEMVESHGWRYDASHHYWTKEKVSEPSLFGSD